MTLANVGQLVAEAWEQELRETSDPFRSPWLLDRLSGRRRTYRDYLDLQPINTFGQRIPRIVTVRRNLRLLGSIRLDPSRLP